MISFMVEPTTPILTVLPSNSFWACTGVADKLVKAKAKAAIPAPILRNKLDIILLPSILKCQHE